MADITQEADAPVGHGPLTREVIAEMLVSNFERLPDRDQKFFQYGTLYLGGNAAFGGLIANSLYRRALNVSKAGITSSLPMATLPFLTTVALYNATVSAPLLLGDLNCPTCALVRGGLVGLVGGGVYPILLALPVNLGLATLYKTSPMPEKGAGVRFSVELSRPVLRKMRALLVLQTAFGAFLSNGNYNIYTKLAGITFGSGAEDLKD